ncbi:hypothetical protein [Paenibacillus piri]|uniref:Uncharacterized protein n=1 Tax=Paenibacillus piri TaxID=2547395 RepID=A0A4R5KZ24_9BACL|nr:hypothetical protein [Paenibacillus piri]TDG00873.1 hypothetical protein E1757_04485 [Paenibacillus piri]
MMESHMLTFSVNKSIRKIADAAYDIIENNPRFMLDPLEREGVSAGFLKLVEGKGKPTDKPINAGAYGYGVERNTQRRNYKREVAPLTAEELEAGVRGVSETVFVAKYSFSNDENWLESLEIDVDLVKTVFQLVEEHIYSHESAKGKWNPASLRGVLTNAMKNNARSQSTLTIWKNEYTDLSFIIIPPNNLKLKSFLEDYGTLEEFLRYILRHRELCEALELYETSYDLAAV